MGNGASVKPECFTAMKDEYEKNKGNMTDEQLFIHMKVFHDNFASPASPTNKSTLPLIFSGPSGTGKGTIISKIMERYPTKFGFSVSHTTRLPRQGEVHGVHYHFTTTEEIEAGIKNGDFVEHAEVHGNKYGTSHTAMKKVHDEGKICILDVDVQGVQRIKGGNIPCKFVFFMPPSLEELEKRLRNRNTESEEKIKLRLENAKAEIEYAKGDNFDAVIVNEEVDKCVNDVIAQLKKWGIVE